MTTTFKIVFGALLLVILIVVSMYVYRLFFMFDKKKLKQYIFDCASTTTAPDKASQLITDGVEHILSSIDLTAQVKLLAEIDGIDPEKALALTALRNCYSSGIIDPPVKTVEQ